ncbi:hypothetical protein DFR65_104210 [Oceanihabitans sediminis]|uniref:Uncharacterized protein n=1 Tax=Oceanihabitans sediminis TaxID=1812012 RepID=A0A368P390_9FLAO|nr:hypothetical protein [Oceanihabitans sediminis]RBP30951.1 hypothetical protein DFR65_104210 [Oceanihabitans sediminis]RCU56906.1 hypothetical protein DU428_11220 [Oceanihabitans sediminis]
MYKAIETSYDGYKFRSRTEARWAVFFNHLGLKWEYEKEGFVLPSFRYLPDFWIPCPLYKKNGGYWLEIKGNYPTEKERKKCKELAKLTGDITLLIYESVTDKNFNHFSYYPIRENNTITEIKETCTSYENEDVSHLILSMRFMEGQMKTIENDKYLEAMNKARSAQFEFGKKG